LLKLIERKKAAASLMSSGEKETCTPTKWMISTNKEESWKVVSKIGTRKRKDRNDTLRGNDVDIFGPAIEPRRCDNEGPPCVLVEVQCHFNP